MVDPKKILADVYAEASRLFGDRLCAAILYGSYARGDCTPESDVDIFLTVDAAPEELSAYRRAVAAVDSELSLAYDVTVSTAVQSDSVFRQYAGILPYYRNVIREGIPYGS